MQLRIILQHLQVFTGATDADVVTVNQNDASIYTATYTVAQGDTNGVLAFTVTSTDAAGNVSTNTSTTNSSSVTIDTDVPALSSVSIASDNSTNTLAKASDTVTLTFTADEAIGTPVVTFASGNGAIAGNRVTVSNLGDSNAATWNASYAVAATDTDGSVTYSISFSDLTGNAGVAVTSGSGSVTVDTAAPSIDAIATSDFDWGAVLNSTESASAQDVAITTTGVENGQVITLTLNNNGGSATASVTNNTASVSISSNILSGLTHGATYAFTANVSDATGNAAAAVTSSNFTVDTSAPTINSVSSATIDGTYKSGDEIVVQVVFNSVVNVTGTPTITLATGGNGDVVGYTQGSGSQYLDFTYTVGAGDTSADLDYISTSALALAGGTIKDVNGNAAVLTLPSPGAANSLAHSKALVVDTTAPTMTITATEVSSGNSSNDATIALTFTSSEVTTNFVSGDVTVTNGSINNTFAASGNSGTTYTATFTPSQDGATTIKVNAGAFTDAVGNTREVSNTFTWTYDGTAPTMTITTSPVVDGTTTNDATLAVTFTSSEVTTNFATGDVSVTNGSIGNTFAASGNGTTYTATFTPSSDGATTIKVNAGAFTDAVGNTSAESNTITWTFDSTVPTVTGVIVAGGDDNYKQGEAVTIEVTFSEAVNVTNAPTLALNTNATASYASGHGTATLTFTYTVGAGENTSDLDYAATSSLSGTIKDLYGNDANLTLATPGQSGSISDDDDVVIDTTAPSVSEAVAVTTPSNDVTPSLTINSNEVGAISASSTLTGDVTAEVGNNTITFDTLDAGSYGSATVTVTDASGNATTITLTTFVIDTTSPAAFQSTTVASTGGTAVSTYYNSTNTAVSVTTPIASNDATLIGGTLQIQAKVAANGTYANIGNAAAITDSGTQTVSLSASDVEDLTNFGNTVSLYFRAIITDSAGNATTGTASATTLTVDQAPPTVSTFSMDDTSLITGDTATVTLTFSEAVTGFNSDDDITEQSGTLGTMTSNNNAGVTWTGTFTPSANTSDSTNTLSLAITYTDVAGNPGPTATTANYVVDTTANTVDTFTMSDTALKAGETSTVTIIFSEAVTGFAKTDITAPNGTLGDLQSQDNITFTSVFTPTADTTDSENVLTLSGNYTDTLGNAGPTGATTAN